MRAVTFGLFAVFLAACGSSGGGGGGDGGSGGGGPESCTEPVSQGLSQPCCAGHGIDACGANLFCAAFDGRTQATCYPERSRPDQQSCTEDRQCTSGSCNMEKGLCRSMPSTSCNPAVGCAVDPAGKRYACIEETGLCFRVGDGSYGSACETIADCAPRLVCDGGICEMPTAVCGTAAAEGPCWDDPNSDECYLCRIPYEACSDYCQQAFDAYDDCAWEKGCRDASSYEELRRCIATQCDSELCAYEGCVAASDCSWKEVCY